MTRGGHETIPRREGHAAPTPHSTPQARHSLEGRRRPLAISLGARGPLHRLSLSLVQHLPRHSRRVLLRREARARPSASRDETGPPQLAPSARSHTHGARAVARPARVHSPGQMQLPQSASAQRPASAWRGRRQAA
eukprot:2157741-Prymnesium_polylepis.1